MKGKLVLAIILALFLFSSTLWAQENPNEKADLESMFGSTTIKVETMPNIFFTESIEYSEYQIPMAFNNEKNYKTEDFETEKSCSLSQSNYAGKLNPLYVAYAVEKEKTSEQTEVEEVINFIGALARTFSIIDGIVDYCYRPNNR